MEMTPKPQTKESMEMLRVQVVFPLIESFFNRMTAEQWGLLKSGTPDFATKINLTELLLDVIATVSKVVTSALQGKNIILPKEHTESSLGDALLQGFGKTLNIPHQVQSLSTKPLSNLVNAEVERIVKSSISGSSGSVVSEHVTPPRTLNTMVVHAIKVLKDCMAKALCIARCRKGKVKTEQTLSSRLTLSSLEEDSFRDVKSVSARVQKALSAEMSAVMEPIMEDMPEYSVEMFRSEISKEMQDLSVDIAGAIVDRSKKNGPTRKCQQFLRGMKNGIEGFFTKCFAKLSILRIMSKIRKNLKLKTKAKSRQSMEPIMAKVESLIKLVKDQDANGKEAPWSAQVDKEDNVRLLMEELTDLLYKNLTERTMPNIASELLHQSPANIRTTLSSQVWAFIALMNWWCVTQVGGHSQRAALALMPTSVETILNCQVTRDRQDYQEQKNKESVRILTEKIAWQLFHKLEMVPSNKDAIMYQFFESTWASVEGVDVCITKDTLQSHKTIVKQLCKQWGDADTVLIALNMKDPEIEKCLASAVGPHLTTPQKQPSPLRRSFSSLGKVISKTRGKKQD